MSIGVLAWREYALRIVLGSFLFKGRRTAADFFNFQKGGPHPAASPAFLPARTRPKNRHCRIEYRDPATPERSARSSVLHKSGDAHEARFQIAETSCHKNFASRHVTRRSEEVA